MPGVGYQAGAFYAFYLVDQSQDGGRDMDAVGHHFHRHVVQQIDAFYRAFVFVLAAFVETGHCIVEVGGMGIASFVGCTDVFKLRLRMGYRCKIPLAVMYFPNCMAPGSSGAASQRLMQDQVSTMGIYSLGSGLLMFSGICPPAIAIFR